MTVMQVNFEEIVENAIDVIYQTDASGKITYINSRVKSFFNINPEDFQGNFIMHFLERLPLIDKETNLQQNLNLFSKAIVDKKKEYSFQFAVSAPSKKYFQVNCRLIWDVKKDVLLGSEGIIHDITALRQLQQQLKESQENYRNILESIRDAVVIIGLDGQFKFVSPQLSQMLGGREIGSDLKSIDKLFHKDDVKQLFALFSQGVTQKTVLTDKEIIFRALHQDGHYIWMACSTRNHYDTDGRLSGFITLIRDITEHKQAELSLKESEEKYRGLINNLSDVIAETEIDGTILYVSHQIFDILGFRPEELIRKKIFDFIHAEDLRLIADSIKKALNTKDVVSADIRVRHKAGHYRHVSGRGNLIEKEGRIKFVGLMRDITDQKMVEEALKKSEKKYQDLYNSAPVAYFSVGIDGLIRKANNAATDFTGYSLEELQGMKVLDIYAEESKAKAKQLFEKFRAGIPWENEEMVYQRKDGNKFYGLLSVNPLIDDTGQVLESRSIVVNITERKKIEMALLENEGLLRERIKELRCLYEISNIFEATTIIADAFFQNISTQIISAFQFPELICVRLRYDKKEYKTNNFKETEWKISVAYPVAKDLLIEVYYTNEIPFILEEIILLKEIGVRLKNFLEQKEAEEKLRESEEKFRVIAENASDLICVVNMKYKYDYANPQFIKILGYLEDDVLGKDGMKLVHPDDIEQVMKIALEGLKSGKGRVETRLKHKDGFYIWFELTGQLYKDKTHQSKIILIMRDISERRKAEEAMKKLVETIQQQNEELKALDRMKDEFFADISHELRTPLVAIKGFSDILLQASNLEEIQRQDIQTILRNEARLDRLINEILEYFRLGSGKISFKKESFRLSEILNELKQELAPLINQKQLIIEENLKSDEMLLFDKDQITKVIKNLLTNALKFSFQEGKIIIRSTIDGESWTFSMQDQGIGIAKQDIPRIFTRFTRLNTGEGMNMSGIGLGLAICKRIIDLYEGKIWVASDGPNQGATFNFQLKLDQTPPNMNP